MKVIVTLTIDGVKETALEGDAPIFDSNNYQAGRNKRLDSIGFWLTDWRYTGHSGTDNTSQVFIPWTSCLMVKTVHRLTSLNGTMTGKGLSYFCFPR